MDGARATPNALVIADATTQEEVKLITAHIMNQSSLKAIFDHNHCIIIITGIFIISILIHFNVMQNINLELV